LGYSDVPLDFNVKIDIKGIVEDLISKKKGHQFSAADLLFKSD